MHGATPVHQVSAKDHSGLNDSIVRPAILHSSTRVPKRPLDINPSDQSRILLPQFVRIELLNVLNVLFRFLSEEFDGIFR